MSSGEQRALPFITVGDAGQFVIGEEAAARDHEAEAGGDSGAVCGCLSRLLCRGISFGMNRKFPIK
mgnify:CR=1 FL=1